MINPLPALSFGVRTVAPAAPGAARSAEGPDAGGADAKAGPLYHTAPPPHRSRPARPRLAEAQEPAFLCAGRTGEESSDGFYASLRIALAAPIIRRFSMLQWLHRLQHHVGWHIRKHCSVCGSTRDRVLSIIQHDIKLIYLPPRDRRRIYCDGEWDRP